MAALKFAETHNLVAFLEKPTESEGFEEIVDFLNANPIKYALTVNPTIYCSCIKQFWDTVKAKTVNGEVQLQALVDKKKVIIIESTLTLMGYEKLSQKLTFSKALFSPQWKFLIHTILQCLSVKTTTWNEFSSTMASAIICSPTEPIPDEAANAENVPTHSNDPLLSGEDSLKLNKLMELCTTLQKKVLDLETSKTTQALEIESLKRRVKKLKKKERLRTHKIRRLYKVGLSAKVVSSDNEASLGDQEDASKQGRKILDINADKDITLDNTHFDTDPDMFGVHDLHGDEVFVETKEPVVNVATTTTTTATTTVADEVEMTLAQTLIEMKSAKPKAKGIVKGQGLKDKGKVKMIEPEKPLKKKDQLLFDEQEAIRLQAHFDEEARVAREKEEANAILVAQWNDIQDKKRMKFFAAKRAEEKRNRPPTKAQQRSIMCIEREESSKKVEIIGQKSNSKRAGDELEQEKAKKQNIDDDQEEAKMKELIEVVSDEEGVAINAIPLSTKPPSIVDYKIIKEGKISIYQIIRADGSSKRYSAVIHMLRNFIREDLETLWKIVKARYSYTRPEEGYKRVLWGDLKIMFEHHVEDLVWRYIQGNKVTVWKLFDSCGVHFVRFSNLHVFMLVEKRYPFTKATTTEMLNKKLQADHWNEMCYQLLKIMNKQLKNQ
ncbi:hypothetical protein Tco_0782382 [Tanacetum coccineum]